MKKFFFLITLISTVFICSVLSAKTGLSFGLLGSYSIDGGAIENTYYKSVSSLQSYYPDAEYDPLLIAGFTAFLRYDFRNNFFIRTGFEINKLIDGGTINYETGSAGSLFQEKYSYKYEANTFPLYFGIILSPDKGKTSVFGAAGIFYSMIDIEREYYYFDETASNKSQKLGESSSGVFGFCGIFGLERIIFSRLYFVVEYAFYAGEKTEKESGEEKDLMLLTSTEYSYRERYGLPKHQVRIGLKYFIW